MNCSLTSRAVQGAPSFPRQYPVYRARRLNSALRATRTDNATEKKEQEVTVPAVGWLWQTGSSRGSSAVRVANLKQDRIKPKKSLGQNFMLDDGVLRDIVASAAVKTEEIILEIGPGTGNLTKHLFETGAQVTAIEKDDTLYARLSEELADVSNLHLVHGDVLSVNLPVIIQEMQERAAALTSSEENAPALRKRIKVVANLPYNITREFLKLMLPMSALVSELHIMIQEEPARRLCDARPGRPDYRAMSLFTHFYSKPKYRFKIAKEKYYPAPKVDGALVSFILLPETKRVPVHTPSSFLMVVNKAFSSRRKMIKNVMQPLFTPDQVEAALEKTGCSPTARAQDLSLQQFAEFHLHLHAIAFQGAVDADAEYEKIAADIDVDGL